MTGFEVILAVALFLVAAGGLYWVGRLDGVAAQNRRFDADDRLVALRTAQAVHQETMRARLDMMHEVDRYQEPGR